MPQEENTAQFKAVCTINGVQMEAGFGIQA